MAKVWIEVKYRTLNLMKFILKYIHYLFKYLNLEDTYLRKFRDISDETKDAIVNTREKLNNINKRIEESGNKELIQLRSKHNIIVE